MCGIHGLAWADLPLIESMIDLARHRGPDGNGHYIDEHTTLGHNLLNITETVANSTQPYILNDNVLTYNGEIYNYRDLRELLQQHGYRFDTDCDTEVLAKGFDKFGVDFVSVLDGMFALCWYNKREGTWTLARDSSGIKPLYYALTERGLAFSSEIKPLRLVGNFSRIDLDGFKLFYKLGCNPGYKTLFGGISKLTPGEVIQIDLKENRIFSSINLNDLQFQKTAECDDNELRARVSSSVKKCLMGRRKIGLYLSGGMDSSMVFAEASTHSTHVKSFSQYYDCHPLYGQLVNEDDQCARQLAQQFGAVHQSMIVNVQEYSNAFRRSISVIEEPRANMGTPSYYLMNKFVSEHGITVTLSGDGGDELAAGYKHHRNALSYTGENPYGAWMARVRDFSASINAIRDPQFLATEDYLTDYMNTWFPTKSLGSDHMNNLMMLDSLVNMSEDFLVRNDKLAMNFSMEGRFPLLVNDVKIYLRGLPSDQKYSAAFFSENWSTANKHIFRRCYRNRLPGFILNKKKSGWTSPIADWLTRKSLTDFIVSSICGSDLRRLFGISNPESVIHMIETHHRRRELFMILYFVIWAEEFSMSL